MGVLDKPVYTLSGGEQQRVAMARLIPKKPRVIIADEPTSALDDTNAKLLIDLLGMQCANGATTIVATHDPHMVRHSTFQLNLAATNETFTTAA